MSPQKTQTREWALASILLDDAYTDFILSRQAMLCSPGTLRFYHFTAGKFVKWLEESGVSSPQEIGARHIRAYLAELAIKKLSDSYINGHARAIRTFVRFLYTEKYIPETITFQMPTIAKKRLLVHSADEVKRMIDGYTTLRDKLIILLLVDTGLRRAEALSLNWDDVDIKSGLVRVTRGKGGKARSVVVGVTTRRMLLTYRREVSHEDTDPLIQTRIGSRLSALGLRSAILRIGKRAGIDVTPHSLRRTFATLSLKAGMNLLHLQGLLGHSTLEMTRHYVQMIDDDLITAHQEHGPVDKFIRG